MTRTDAGVEDLAGLRTVADYQFGAGAGAALFPPDEDLRIRRSNSGRPRQVVAGDPGEDPRVVSYGTDGRFTLGIEGGRRLRAAFDPPRARVAVGEESREFVRDGRNAFAKFVRSVDPSVRPGDDVVVVDDRDELLGVGRAELPADWMADFDSGMAVKVRHGAPE